VFSIVAAGLEDRGFEVQFFEPGRAIDPSLIDELSLLVNKKVVPASIRSLRYAERSNIPTWNGSLPAILGARPLGMNVLEAAGFLVPETTFERPEGPYVSKPIFDWHGQPDPELYGDGPLFQELLPTEPIDFKYYAVKDDDRTHIVVLRVRSKLLHEKTYVNRVRPDPTVASKVRRLLDLVDAQAIGVDLVHARGEFYAVDVNPAPSFRQTDLEVELVESIVRKAAKMGHGLPAAGSRTPEVGETLIRTCP
jgi:hypothetical protein